MEFSVTLGDLIVSAAAGVLTWQAADVLREVRMLSRRVTDLEAWGKARELRPFVPREL